MENTNNKTARGRFKLSFVDYLFEVTAWILIFSSPLLISLVLSVIVYRSYSGPGRLIIALCILLTGIITGIRWATHHWKKRGTMHFISRIPAKPELDPKE